jgi:nicotinate-nucleotide--dimethylbenzimidazole phosphoribosyltransferase
MNPPMPVAPAAEVTRRPTGDPPGDPPGDFGPVLAQTAQAPPESRHHDARTATAEGADSEAPEIAAREGGVETEPGTEAAKARVPAPALAAATTIDATLPESAVVADPAPAVAPWTRVPGATAAAASQQPAPEQRDQVEPAVTVKAPPDAFATEPAPVVAEPSAATTGDVVAPPVTGDAPPAPEATAQMPAAAAPPVETLHSSAQTGSADTAEATPASQPAAPVSSPQQAAEGSSPELPLAASQHSDSITAAAEPRGSAATAAARPAAAGQPAQAAPSEQPAAEAPPPSAASVAAAKPDPAANAAEPAPQAQAQSQPQPQPQPQTQTQAPGQTQAQPAAAPTRHAADPERPAAAAPPPRAHAQLAELAQTARTVVRLAAREGAAQAHITLHPAELGEVEIRLRYHAGGVSADVLADSHAAVQVLQQASAELRRSLEAQGLAVHDLDVRQGEQEQRRAGEHRHHGHRHADAHGRAIDHPDHTTIEASRLPLAAGAIDVLA